MYAIIIQKRNIESRWRCFGAVKLVRVFVVCNDNTKCMKIQPVLQMNEISALKCVISVSYALRFGVWGLSFGFLGFKTWTLGFEVWGLGFESWGCRLKI